MYTGTTSCLIGITVLLSCLYVVQSVQPSMPVIPVVPVSSVFPFLDRFSYLGVGILLGSTLKNCPEDKGESTTPMNCPESFTALTADGKTFCYKYISSSPLYDQAKELCRDSNGHIVKLDSEAEFTVLQTFVSDNNVGSNGIWINGVDTDNDGTFITHDGEVFPYDVTGNLSNCLEFKTETVYYTQCDEDFHLVCESDPV